eukprot:m.45117 g.45117  ORF g.45117 m.45117 type:complete len:54 (-) comp10193_c1_seq2:139-300(-)
MARITTTMMIMIVLDVDLAEGLTRAVVSTIGVLILVREDGFKGSEVDALEKDD